MKQPWASLIARGHKTIELRTWRTHYRGPLLIASSVKPDADAELAGIGGCIGDERPFGVVVAEVELLDVRPFERGDERRSLFDPGASPRFSWVLGNARALEAPYVPVRGALGLFSVDDAATLRAIRQNLEGVGR